MTAQMGAEQEGYQWKSSSGKEKSHEASALHKEVQATEQC